jgi:hypothetical protein
LTELPEIVGELRREFSSCELPAALTWNNGRPNWNDGRNIADADSLDFFRHREVKSIIEDSDFELHAAYAIPYLNEQALLCLLPLVLEVSATRGFRYGPILDAVTLGLSDPSRSIGKLLPSLTPSQRRVVINWLLALKKSERYDDSLIQNAMNGVNSQAES